MYYNIVVGWLISCLTPCRPLWVILRRLPEKGRKSTEKIAEDRKEKVRREGKLEKENKNRIDEKKAPTLNMLLVRQEPSCQKPMTAGSNPVLTSSFVINYYLQGSKG